jgi:hypothetical protein
MTPIALEIIIHYHYSPEQYRSGDFSAPAVREAIGYFEECGLLEEDYKEGGGYSITEKGRFYVEEGLCQVPFPEEVSGFVIPGKDEVT